MKVSIKFHGAQYSEKAPKLENLIKQGSAILSATDFEELKQFL